MNQKRKEDENRETAQKALRIYSFVARENGFWKATHLGFKKPL
jgi:hypothetical protein